MASHPTPATSWKQEVNRRVAAHKSRRVPATEQEAPGEARRSANSRGAQAAARVAARYAKAPTYSQMQAAEARAAVRSAEIATRVALEEQAAARAVLANLEAASRDKSKRRSLAAAPASLRQDGQVVGMRQESTRTPQAKVESRREAEEATRREEPEAGPEGAREEEVRGEVQGEVRLGEPREWPADPLGAEKLDRLEAALTPLPFHANLIEFPREHAAPRKGRTRKANDADEPQLSIFEVDPERISISNELEDAVGPVAPQWGGMELDAHPMDEPEAQVAACGQEPVLMLAPFSRRVLAGLVDGALVTGAFLAAALVAAINFDQLPSLRFFEIGSLGALFVIAGLYHLIFFTLSEATPGMKYARVSLCTFDDQCPTRAQMRGRVGALMLSVLPLGLGVAWAIFDEDHLSWHDRWSRTYQRKDEV